MDHFNIGRYMLVAGLIGGLSFTFLLTIVHVNYPRSIGGVAEWVGACILIALSAVLSSGAVPINDGTALLVGHVIFLCGLALVDLGLRRFAGMAMQRARLLCALACAVVLLGVTTLLGLPERFAVIVGMVMAIVLVQASLGAVLTLPNKTIPEWAACASLVALIGLCLLRLSLIAADIDTASLYLDARLPQKTYVLGMSICLFTLMASFLLMAAKRLRETLVSARVYDERDVRERAERWSLGQDLRKAIVRGELAIHYQPRVDTHSGEVVSVEALLRWKHPVKGYIGPDLFIPIAEENGSIHDIGTWVLKEGAACAARLNRQYPHLKMSINVSARQLACPGFVELVRRTLDNAGTLPGAIELELTETIAIEDPERAVTTLRELRSLGVQLSIDDFGTGYSSLAYLMRLPVSCVKIDRSLICDVPALADARALTQAIIGIGNALGVSIVAEGVESQQQMEFLRDAGVHEYQGFLFSRPVPEAALLALLAEQRGQGTQAA